MKQCKPDSVRIKKSSRKDKKLMASFYKNEKIIKTIHFGANGYSDFTIHKNNERKQRYINRHKKRENWENPCTAGSLSRYILWENPSLSKSIEFYTHRFKLYLIK